MKEVLEFFKKSGKTKKGRGIMAFIIFGVFVVVIMILARVGTHQSLEDQLEGIRNANNKDNGVDISDLLRLNFSYEYTINHDNNIYKLKGKMDSSSEEGTFSYGKKEEKYYRNEDGLYKYVNLKWIDVLNISSYDKYFDIRNVDKLIEKASYDSNTSYKDGRSEYNLLISVNTINDIINNKTTDFSDDPCSINIMYDNKGKVDYIKFDYTNYCKLMNSCKNNFNITLDYDDIDNIKSIDNPLD